MKKNNAIFFVASAVLIIFFACIMSFGLTVGDYQVKPIGSTLKYGLDLKGGVSIIEEAKDKNVSKDTMERAKQLLEMRVNNLGVAEPNVQITGQNRVLIEMPGVYDAKKALEEVGKTGKLRFVGPNNDEILTGSDVEDATVGVDPNSNQPVVQLKLKSEGTTKFAAATQKYIGQKITIYMDDEVVSAPTVQSAIPDGSAVITGSKDISEAKRLAGVIKSGALPVELSAAQVRTIGPSLGAKAIPTSVKAAIVGISLVMLFMLIRYRIPGLIANLALTVFIILNMLVFIILNATVTLPGIAGLLLTIGMAVDANILIFERMKDEIKLGKSLNTAVDIGFKKALSAIIDSNVTTLIAGFVLYFLGAGSVQGFALNLIIGVFCSLFTAITVTRFLLKSFINAGWVTDTKFYVGLRRNNNA